MSRRVLAFVLAVLLVSLLGTTVFAANEEDRFYDIGTMSGATLEADAQNPGRLKLSLSDAAAGKDYLVLLADGTGLPTAATAIRYIDAKTAQSAALSFTVFPKMTEADDSMTVYLTSNDTGFITKSASVKYGTEPAFKLGDVNGNQEIDSMDASLILQHLVGTYTIENTQVGDVNGNQEIDGMDASLILQHLVGTYTIE